MFNCDNPLEHHISSIIANYFIDKLNNITGKSFNINVYSGYSRCLARIWDINNPEGPDINKRCKHTTLEGMCVCKTHLTHHKHGMVNEYPPEHVIRCYANKTKNIADKIDLNHTLNIIENNNTNKHLKKNITYKSKQMSLEQINYIHEIKSYTSIHNEVDKVAISSQIVKNHQLKHMSIAEMKEIETNIMQYSLKLGMDINKKSDIPKKNSKKRTFKIKKKSIEQTINKTSIEKTVSKNTIEQKVSQDSSLPKKINLDKCECIKIIDEYQMSADVYVDVDHSCIYNDKKNTVGSIHKWIDEEDEIPESFKNADNLVLHPKTRLPLLEYHLNEGAAVFCDVKQGMYREFEYDEDFESFKKTNQVLRCE